MEQRAVYQVDAMDGCGGEWSARDLADIERDALRELVICLTGQRAELRAALLEARIILSRARTVQMAAELPRYRKACLDAEDVIFGVLDRFGWVPGRPTPAL